MILSRRDLALGAGAGVLWRTPARAASPIRHVVVVLRENHSFDNYFGAFPGADGRVLGGQCGDSEPDPPHMRADALAGAAARGRGRCHYEADQIPAYQQWARQFVLCDRYFGELLAPSVPNYFALMGAAAPVLSNPPGDRTGTQTELSLIDRLNARNVTWRNYHGGIQMVKMFRAAVDTPGGIVPISRFQADAAAGNLPAVSWLTPSLADSEHPPHSVRRGESWTTTMLNAVITGPAWESTAIFVVWDEWGGFDDHVPPPVSPAARDAGGMPIRYGYRVPCLVISPYAKRGFVSHTVYSHASVVKTIRAFFDLPAVTDADANANDLLDCFTFAPAGKRRAG